MKLLDKINNIIKRVQNSGFIKSVLTLASGTVFAQFINFIGMPIVGRIYTPAEMGDYSLVTANAGTITAIACLGLMTSVMLPKTNREARGLVKLVIMCTLTITSLIIIVMSLMTPYYRFFNTSEVSYIQGLVVLWGFIISNVTCSICYGYANRLKMYRVMFWNPIIGSIANVALAVVFGLFGLGFVGYTLSHIISLSINIIHLLFYANPFINAPGIEESFFLIREYKRFPLYQMPANLIQNLSNQIPLQMIELSYSNTSLGMYSMALRILSIPATLLAVPINRVYYQEANERYNNGESIGPFSFKILEANIKIAIVPFVIIIIFGKYLFSFFLGDQWAEAGVCASIMGLYQLMLFCASCLSGNFIVIRKNNWSLFSSIALLIIEIVIVFVFGSVYTVSFRTFLFILCICLTLYLTIVEGVFLVYTGVNFRKYVSFVIKYIFLPYVLSLFVNTFID